MEQAKIEHPLTPYGFRQAPHRLWRWSPKLFMVAQAVIDVALIATGRLSLHRAWQAGYDRGAHDGQNLGQAANHKVRILKIGSA